MHPAAPTPARNLGLAVFLGCLLLYVPLCGSYGFWDCWEGHYAEVARQMRVRGDWISLWWPGSPVDRPEFWSKPVFTFWVEALMFKLLGVGQPALSSATEWACRLPMAIFGALGVWGVFHATGRLVSWRAGLLAAIVCATAPMYFFVSRQALTDMPFVGPMTAAMGLGMVALLDEDAEAPRLRWVALAALAVLVVPQLVYDSIALRRGWLAMLPYAAVAGFAAWRIVRARMRSQSLIAIAYVLCGVAGLAKGLVGIGLPGAALVLYLACTRDRQAWRRLRPLDGIAIVVAVAFPWYHAMLIRHGLPFWNELFGDNHWRRLAIGRHGDNAGGFDYYLRELGFGLFPWTALAAVALPAAIARARSSRFLTFTVLWAIAAYAVVSCSMTKFHHYILPAVPAIAMLVGWLLDSALDRGVAIAALLLFGVPVLALVTWNLAATPQLAQRLLWLFDYDYINNPRGRPWPAGFDYRVWLVVAGALAAVATVLGRRWALAVVGLAFTVFAIDGMLIQLSPHWSQKHLLATYYRQRQSGDRLVAWELYWRGETFYSENELYDPRLPPDERTVFFREFKIDGWLARHHGTRVFFLLDRGRLPMLAHMVPGLSIADDSNNKFILAVARL